MNTIINPKKVLKNTTILIATQIGTQIIAFITSIKIANYLGVEQYGLYAFAFAFTSLFTFAVDWGLNFWSFREFSRDAGSIPRYYGTIMIIKTLLGLAVIGLYGVVSQFLQIEQATRITVWLGFMVLVITSLNGLALSVYQSQERMEFQGITQLAGRLLILAVIVWYVVRYDAGLYAVFYAMIVTFSLLFFLHQGLARRFGARIWSVKNITAGEWKNILKLGLPFLVIGILNQLYLHVDITMLRVMKGTAEVGIYAIPARMVGIGILLPAALVNALFPALNKIKDRELFSKVIGTAFRYLLLISIPLGFGTLVLARDFISLFYRAEYLPAAVCLQVLIWALVLMFGNWVLGNSLYALGKEKIMMLVMVSTVLINVILNLLLIPQWGYTGAAAATVAVEVFVLVIEFCLLGRIAGFKADILPIIRGIACAAIMMSCLFFLRGHIHFWLSLMVGIIIYVGLAFLTRAVKLGDMKKLATYRTTV